MWPGKKYDSIMIELNQLREGATRKVGVPGSIWVLVFGDGSCLDDFDPLNGRASGGLAMRYVELSRQAARLRKLMNLPGDLRRWAKGIWRFRVVIPLKSLFPKWRRVTWGAVPADHDWKPERSPLREGGW